MACERGCRQARAVTAGACERGRRRRPEVSNGVEEKAEATPYQEGSHGSHQAFVYAILLRRKMTVVTKMPVNDILGAIFLTVGDDLIYFYRFF
jgi:hypothetical protein